MQNETTTTPVAKAPKQFTFGVTEKHKKVLGELRNEFTRTAAVAKAPPVSMSEKELIEVLYEVATNRRFRAQHQHDEHGQPVFDEEGQPVIESVDLFAEEWDKIKARDYVEGATPRDPVAALVASVKRYGKALNMSDEEIAERLKAIGVS